MSTLGEGFELLGIKWLPSLNPLYAKELTPYEVGDKEWKSSLQGLSSGKEFQVNATPLKSLHFAQQ